MNSTYNISNQSGNKKISLEKNLKFEKLQKRNKMLGDEVGSKRKLNIRSKGPEKRKTLTVFGNDDMNKGTDGFVTDEYYYLKHEVNFTIS